MVFASYSLIKVFEEPDGWGFSLWGNTMNTEKYNVNLPLCDWQLTKHSLNCSDTVNPSPSGTSSRLKQKKKVKLISKYLTQAWCKNKSPGSQQTPHGAALTLESDGWWFRTLSEPSVQHSESDLKELWPTIRGSSGPFVYMPMRCPVAVLHTHTIIKLLTPLRLSLFDKTPLFEFCDYCRCSGQPCHTKFTCLVFIVWLPLSLSSPHTWWCESAAVHCECAIYPPAYS